MLKGGGGGSQVVCRFKNMPISYVSVAYFSYVTFHFKKKAMLHSLFFKANVACRPVEF